MMFVQLGCTEVYVKLYCTSRYLLNELREHGSLPPDRFAYSSNQGKTGRSLVTAGRMVTLRHIGLYMR